MRSSATTLQPAIALVLEQISTIAFTPSISAVMRWSSPTQLGTECIVTPVTSGPVVASDVATATFTRRGKVAMASLALPVKTVVFSVSVSRCSAQTGVLRKPRAPVCVSNACRFRQVLCLRHQADGLQHVKAADCAAG